MHGRGVSGKARCAAGLLPLVLVLAFATLASASGLRSSAAGAWGPPGGPGHGTRAALAPGSGAARIAGRRAASPALGAAGAIEGTVTDAVTTAGIEGIEVCAWPSGFEDEEDESECRRSGAGGAYELPSLAPGEYVVEFTTPFNSALNYVTQFYPDEPSFGAATPVVVGAGSKVEANAAMAHGGRVAGKVTAAAGGSPIAGIEVCAWNTVTHAGGCAETGAGGEYLVSGVAAGSARVGFRSTGGLDYVTQFYNGKSSYLAANDVTVSAEATTKEIDAAMVRGGEISGFVTLAASGAPLSEAFVCAVSPSSEELGACAETEPNGHYTLTGLPEGDFDVAFEGGPGLEEEFWDGVFSLGEATPVHVTPGSARTGIDAAMYPVTIAPHLEGERFPTISGAIAVGSTVSCSPGSWAGTPPLSFSYQWLRTRVAIPGATATSYTIQSADIGQFVACEVTAANRRGSSWARSIGYRVPVPAPIPAPPAPPAGGVQGLTVAAPSIAVLGRLGLAHGSAVVKLRCAVGPCHGSLQLVLTVTRRLRSGGHTVTRHVTLTIGSAGFSLAQGATGKVAIHLTPAGRRRLADAARHPHPAKLKLTMQNASASSRAVVIG